MSKMYKEMIVSKPSPFGGDRKFFYSENPQLPKYRLLLDQSCDGDKNNLWNALSDFDLLIGYDQVSAKQRILKVVISFHSFSCSSWVSGGLEHIQGDGIEIHELLIGLKEIGAERQHNIVTSYINSAEDDSNREYYQCMSDTRRSIVEYVKKNIVEFVEWA